MQQPFRQRTTSANFNLATPTRSECEMSVIHAALGWDVHVASFPGSSAWAESLGTRLMCMMC